MTMCRIQLWAILLENRIKDTSSEGRAGAVSSSYQIEWFEICSFIQEREIRIFMLHCYRLHWTICCKSAYRYSEMTLKQIRYQELYCCLTCFCQGRTCVCVLRRHIIIKLEMLLNVKNHSKEWTYIRYGPDFAMEATLAAEQSEIWLKIHYAQFKFEYIYIYPFLYELYSEKLYMP